MLTWKIPYWNIPIDARVILQISKGELPQKPLDFPKTIINNELWILCESCWTTTSELRPSAKEIPGSLIDTLERDSEFGIHTIILSPLTSRFSQ